MSAPVPVSSEEIQAQFDVALSDELLRDANITHAHLTKIKEAFDIHAGANGLMDEETFNLYMSDRGIPDNLLPRYFHAFDTAQTRSLDRHQFEVGVIAMDPYTPHGGAWGAERLTFIFSLYDTNYDREINYEEFQEMVADVLIARKEAPTAAAVARVANKVWSFFGKDPSEAGTSIFFNEFHQAVGRQIFRGTSKLFRFARSTLHGSGSTAPTASPSVRSAVATPSRTSDAPASPAPSTAHNSHLLALPGIRLNGASPHSPSSYMTPSKSQSAPMLGGGRAPGSHVKIYPKHMCAEDHHYEQAFERRENHRLLRRQHHFVSESHGREARKKVEFIDPEMVAPSTTPTKADNDITSAVIEPLLLDPNGWTPSSSRAFTLLSVDEIHALCDKVTAILGDEDICVEVPAPAKVFGDIHGQIGDLLNFFTTFGSPNHFTGDIELVNYVFLGDYVDRGAHSVEVVVLLLSLKLRYPGQVFLLRGNHEDGEINAHYGFKAECVERFPRGEGEAVWHAFNAVFNWLPVAGVIQGEIFCCHGGVGETLMDIDQLRTIQKPVTIEALEGAQGDIIRDVMWSDPTTSDCIVGVHANDNRGPSVTMFGPDRVKAFCERNGLSLIVRAHECVAEGYELFASGHLVTVFSATNYQGQYHNDGAYLEVTRALKVTPKVIKAAKPHPRPESAPVSRGSVHSEAAAGASHGSSGSHHRNRHHRSQDGRPSSASARSHGNNKFKIAVDGKENAQPHHSRGKVGSSGGVKRFGSAGNTGGGGGRRALSSIGGGAPPASGLVSQRRVRTAGSGSHRRALR